MKRYGDCGFREWEMGRSMPQGTGLPLILAVEADSRQAAELSSLFQTEFSAELILASSAQQALATVGSRIPDLVLTSALIPPKDEAALTTWLRKLGDAAAHVQTVTIPALATAKAPPSSFGTKALSLVRQRPTGRLGAGQLRSCRVCRLRGALPRPRVWRSITRAGQAPSEKAWADNPLRGRVVTRPSARHARR